LLRGLLRSFTLLLSFSPDKRLQKNFILVATVNVVTGKNLSSVEALVSGFRISMSEGVSFMRDMQGKLLVDDVFIHLQLWNFLVESHTAMKIFSFLFFFSSQVKRFKIYEGLKGKKAPGSIFFLKADKFNKLPVSSVITDRTGPGLTVRLTFLKKSPVNFLQVKS
jgi:hypothetical protein